MGTYYAHNLVRKLGLAASDVVVYDRINERSHKLADELGITATDALQTEGVDAFIIATNTPSHDELIVRLAREGVRHILVEKPLAQTSAGVSRIIKECGNVQVYTGLVINFSRAIEHLLAHMRSEQLLLHDFYGRWGKNRGTEKELRPTPGDLEDEAVHPIGVFLLLAEQGRTTRELLISGQLGWLPYVNRESQALARKHDPSFPERPNHSTSANIRLEGSTPAKASIYSSFLHPVQVRLVGGIIGTNETPTMGFEINFDQNRPEKIGGAVDTLVMTDIKSGATSVEEFPADKLNDLTAAFVNLVRDGTMDTRLATIAHGGTLVDIAEAIIESDRHDSAVRVFPR